jgi:hypothetical protein
MPTFLMIGIGFAVLAVLVLVGRATAIGFGVLRPWFTGFWALAAAINIYVTVAFARQPFAAELPSFVAIAVLPIAAAYALRWLGIGRE